MIKQNAFQAGIWLAPFIARQSSKVARKNQQWILKNRFGLPMNTGFVWNQFGLALDPSHPGFLEYLEQVISTMTVQWGYEYLKLDFLYTGVLPGIRYDPGLTRAQALYQALRLIRDTAGESAYLVGCGCPLGAGIGLFDSMRIGPDVATTWKPSFSPFSALIKNEPSLPAAANSIRNVLNRAVFHQRWWDNDPDCLTVREQTSSLTLEEIQSLATAIGMAGGSLLLSDRFVSVSTQRLNLFGMLIPPMSNRMRLESPKGSHQHPIVIRELTGDMGKWWLIGCFNLDDRPHRFDLSLDELLKISGVVHVFDVWNERYLQHKVESPLVLETSAHHVSLLAIREMNEDPCWVGDKLHLSQGLIVNDWEVEAGHLRIRLKTGRRCDGPIWIYLPAPFQDATIDGHKIDPEVNEDGLLLFQLNLIEEGVMQIHWSEDHDDH